MPQLRASGAARRIREGWDGCPKKRIAEIKVIGREEENEREHLFLPIELAFSILE